MLRGIGLDLGAIERNVSQLHQAGRPAQLQHLHEQLAQRPKVPAAKLGEGAEVRPVQRRHRHEVHALLAGLRQPARRVDPAAVAVQQQRHHHRRMVRRIAAVLVVARQDRRQVELLAHRVANEVRNVPRRNQILHRRWQKPYLVDVPGTKGLAHAA